MSIAMRAGVAVLALGLAATGIAVVFTKHEARDLFIRLQGLNGERTVKVHSVSDTVYAHTCDSRIGG